MTTTEILTGIKNWVLSKLSLKQDAINDLADIRSGSQAGSTAVQPSDLSSYFNNASYDTNTHRINFYHGQNIVAYVDASPFIVDGMVNDVRIENGYLVIDFNTDSGKQDISIPLTDIFDPSNYYNKTQTDLLLTKKQDVIQDLADIRSGAHAGSTAVQPSTLSNVVKNMVAESGVYDVSANNDNAKFESLSALLSSANLNTLIPTDIRKGGMSIKFVQSSDNKYVQFRLMSDTFNTTEANWQGVDEEPIAKSENLVTSRGISKSETSAKRLSYADSNKVYVGSLPQCIVSYRLWLKNTSVVGKVGIRYFLYQAASNGFVFGLATADGFSLGSKNIYDGPEQQKTGIETKELETSAFVISITIDWDRYNGYKTNRPKPVLFLEYEYTSSDSYKLYKQELSQVEHDIKDDAIAETMLYKDVDMYNMQHVFNGGKNLLNPGSRIDNYYISKAGVLTELQNWCVLNSKIPAKSNQNYTYNNANQIWVYEYSSDGQFITYHNTAKDTEIGDNVYTFTTRNNTAYLLISMRISYIEQDSYLVEGNIVWNDVKTFTPIKDIDDIKDVLKNIVSVSVIVAADGSGDYNSILSALKDTPNTTKVYVKRGVYNITQEYIDFYGSNFWTEYTGYSGQTDSFLRGLWLGEGRILEGEAGTKIIFDYPSDGPNVDVIKAHFSIIAVGANTKISNVTLEEINANTVEYIVHDDFSNTGNPSIIAYENVIFKGTGILLGAGLGTYVTYYINECMFLNKVKDNKYDVSYHGSTAGVTDNICKIFMNNCYAVNDIWFRWMGSSISMSEIYVSNSKAHSIKCIPYSTPSLVHTANMAMLKFNCSEEVEGENQNPIVNF